VKLDGEFPIGKMLLSEKFYAELLKKAFEKSSSDGESSLSSNQEGNRKKGIVSHMKQAITVKSKVEKASKTLCQRGK
jgi:hypothetical protein